MEDNAFYKAHAEHFDAWRRELAGPDVLAPLDSTRRNDREVPWDEYGLPARSPEAGTPDARCLELRWHAVLLDHPHTPGHLRGTWRSGAAVMNLRADAVLSGTARFEPETTVYVLRWRAAGFSPELYALLHATIWTAVESAEILARHRGREQWLIERLQELHLAQRKLGPNGDNLQPEHWRDLPTLLCRVRPSVAIKKIIVRGM